MVLGYGFYYHCPEGHCANSLKTMQQITSVAKNLSKGAQPQLKNKYNLNDDLANQLIVLNQRDRLYTSTVPVNFIDYNMIQQDGLQFDVDGDDVMVFLHIQKTGGTTFEKHLVNDIDLQAPCQCKEGRKGRKGRRKKKKKKQHCTCFRPGSKNSWLFSRYNTGWKCGLHADWTELTECVDSFLDATEGVVNRRYFYMTFLREPIARYISEFLHVQRGATWKGSQYMCDGKPATEEEVPPCYAGDDWSGVTLRQFSSCPSNMAFNRQTRMLSDLRLVNCYNTTGMTQNERDKLMLSSAKANLEKMAFFGITAQQSKSQYLFEDTFNLKFKVNFEEQEEDQHSQSVIPDLDNDTLQKIKDLNKLDVELYEYAKALMNKRYNEVLKDPKISA